MKWEITITAFISKKREKRIRKKRNKKQVLRKTPSSAVFLDNSEIHPWTSPKNLSIVRTLETKEKTWEPEITREPWIHWCPIQKMHSCIRETAKEIASATSICNFTLEFGSTKNVSSKLAGQWNLSLNLDGQKRRPGIWLDNKKSNRITLKSLAISCF